MRMTIKKGDNGMRRFIAILLAVAMIFAFSACGSKDKPKDPGDDQETLEDDQDNEDEDFTEDEQEYGDEPEEVVKENLLDPSEVEPRGDEPPTGDDKSTRGIPDLTDVLEYDDGDLLVLVNKYHGVLPTYEPKGMVQLPSGMGTWDDLSLKKKAYKAYLKMYEAAKEEGFDLKVCSAYRSYDGQQQLFTSALANYSEEYAHMYSAYPGRSEHHTGLAVDITSASMDWGLRQDFADYPDGKWLYEHCQDYGFILRYPEGKEDITGYMYEPWHFRYVGKKVAKEIMKKGITLEEYLGKVDE